MQTLLLHHNYILLQIFRNIISLFKMLTDKVDDNIDFQYDKRDVLNYIKTETEQIIF